ncbi:Uncharacterised protein [Bordetella pertussis]|nr:Uncharacterised protein [Bordetella pertussis]
MASASSGGRTLPAAPQAFREGRVLGADQRAQPRPVGVHAAEDVDVAVGAAVNARRRRGAVAVAHGRAQRVAFADGQRRRPDQHGGGHLHHRQVDQAALAGRVQHGHGAAHAGVHAAEHVHRPAGRQARRTVFIAVEQREAGLALGDGVHADALVLLAIARHQRDDQARKARAQRRPPQVQLCQRGRRQVADEGVGRLEQGVERGAVGRHAQVQHLAALAGVEAARVIAAVGVALQRAHPIALRRFDLDDIGAEVGQVLGRGGAGDELREVDHPAARHRPGQVRGGLRHGSPAWPCARCAAACRTRPPRPGSAPAVFRAGAATAARPRRRPRRSRARPAASRRSGIRCLDP